MSQTTSQAKAKLDTTADLSPARLEHPQYQAAVQAFVEGDTAAFRLHRKDKRLSSTEKALLSARMLNRDRKWDKAIQLLDSLHAQSSAFLTAEKHFVLATSLLYLADYEVATLHNMAALRIYQKLKDRRGKFLCLYNLSVDYSRLGLLKISAYYLSAAEKAALTPSELVLIYRAHACQFSKEQRFDEACTAIEHALKQQDALGHQDRCNLLTISADIFFRSGKWDQALDTLKTLRTNKQFNLERPRVEFEYRVLSALRSNESLPNIPVGILPSREYALQWEILKALQGGERQRAEMLWSDLQKVFPQTFGEDFSCIVPSEEKTIFYTFLKSLLQTLPKEIPHELQDNRLGRLYRTLSESSSPVRKETLIEAVWQTSYSPTLDSRFYKLIERLKKSLPKQQKIQCVNRAYILQQLCDDTSPLLSHLYALKSSSLDT